MKPFLKNKLEARRGVFPSMGRVAAAAVAFEMAEAADGPPLLRVPAEFAPAGADGTRSARVVLASGLAPPGD